MKCIHVSQTYDGMPGLGIASCGHWKIENHFIENRTRKDYLIIYCTNGSGIYVEGKKEYKIGKGTLFAAFPDIPHSYQCDQQGWEIWFVHFGGEMADRLMEWTKLGMFNPVAQIGIRNELVAIFDQIVITAAQKKLNYEITTAGFLYQLLLKIKTCMISQQMEKAGLEMAINSRMDNIEKIARLAGMSKFHFIREFKKATGITPGKYIVHRKITLAKELLHNRKMTIKEIAFKVGFNDADYFSKAFKKYTGSKPKVFRLLSD